LGITRRETELLGLESIFTDEEVWSIIKELPPNRASRPDGFVRVFYKRAWAVIKLDIMAVVLKLYVRDGQNFSRLNML
jgi:hypothetical protein